MMHDVGMPALPVRPIQSVDRALGLLDAIAGSAEPLATSELARRAGVNRSTAWRLLATLEAHRLVDRDPATGGYRIAYGAVRLAAAASPAALARRLRPTLEWLVRETGESAQLTVLEAGTLRVIDEVAAPSVLTVRWLGRLLPFDTSSVGKVLYAYRPPAELDALLSRPLERRTERTITDPVAFRAAVDDARRTGIGSSVGEYDLDVNGYSSAVVDRGVPIAFLSVSGPAARIPPARLDLLGPALLEAAERAGRALGVAA
jgi:DNA-binding IclR family transcriptional regulator